METEHNIFFDEFKNKLTILEDTLKNLKIGEYDKENINEIFRSIHTIKGTADLLGMFEVVSLTHKAEDLLQFVRDEKIRMSATLVKLFLELKNFIVLIVDNISNGIFDDASVENLFIYFEKELNKSIRIAQNIKEDEGLEKTILIVEHSAIVRYTLKRIALDEGYNVLTADNEEDAWHKIKNHTIDLLFCDFAEPNESSIDLAETIRIDFATKDLPIVMILSESTKKTNLLGKSLLAKAWIKKPILEKEVKLILKKIFTHN